MEKPSVMEPGRRKRRFGVSILLAVLYFQVVCCWHNMLGTGRSHLHISSRNCFKTTLLAAGLFILPIVIFIMGEET